MQPLIQPNWHIALVHFPIALIVVGTLVELFSFLGWRGSGFRRAGRWMLLLGAVTAVSTTFSGLYAWSEELNKAGGIDALRQAKPALADLMTLHVWTQSAATVLCMFIVVAWVALSDRWRDRLNLLFKLGLLAVSGLILFGSHLGGESVYNHALAVDADRPSTTLPSIEQARKLETYEQLLPVDQAHITMAGLAMAVACVTLGVAIRTVHSGLTNHEADIANAERIAAAFAPKNTSDENDPLYTDYPNRSTHVTVVASRNSTPPLRATKFWLLSFLLLTLTSALGWWIAASSAGWDVNAIWDYVRHPVEPDGPAFTRRLAHVIVATTLIVDTLVLALIARFSPRSSVALLVFAVPLVLALTAQVWLGVLLQFTGPMGAVTRFTP